MRGKEMGSPYVTRSQRFIAHVLSTLTVLLLPLVSLGAYAASKQSEGVYGTAFAVSASGHLITAYHVVKAADRITVFDPRQGVSGQARLVSWSEADDLALIHVHGVSTKPFPVPAQVPLEEGQAVFAVGYAGPERNAEGLQVTPGVISGALTAANRLVFRHTAEVSPGRSGGPVLGERGDVIGMVVARMSASQIPFTSSLVNNSLAINTVAIMRLLASSGLAAASPSQQAAGSSVGVPHVGMAVEKFSGSIFKVFGSTSTEKTRRQKEQSLITADNGLQEMLSSMSSEMGRKFFGAYSAGFTRFTRVAGGVVMLSPKSVSRGAPPNVSARVIVSTDEPSFAPGEVIYFSSINDVLYSCSDSSLALLRKEFKREAFGVGDTVNTFRLKSGIDPSFRSVNSVEVRRFLSQELCKDEG